MGGPDVAPVPRFGSQPAHELARYFFASLAAFFADTGSLALMTSVFGVQYLISAPIAFMFGLVIVYVLSIRWVFETRTLQSARKEFAVFLAIGIVGLLINEGVLWLLTGFFGMFYLVSKLVSVFVVFGWDFLTRKALLFR